MKDPRVQKLITAGLGRATKEAEGSGFFTDLSEDLRPVMKDPRVQKLITAGLGRATREAEGSGLMEEIMKHKDSGKVTVRDVAKMVKGQGMRSRKKSKDHITKRAFDEYIKNEMERASRKDLAEARAMRAGTKAKPSGGYGYGLKGSSEMKEKMAKLRAMRKKK